MSNYIPKGSKKCLQKILNSVKVKDIFAHAETPELSIHFSTHLAELENLLKGEEETFAWTESFEQNLLTVVRYTTGKKLNLVCFHSTGEFFFVNFWTRGHPQATTSG